MALTGLTKLRFDDEPREIFKQSDEDFALLEEYFIRRYKKSFISNDVDFDARQAARTAEIGALKEAKEILSGMN